MLAVCCRVRGVLFSRTSPLSGAVIELIMRISVVLPAPLGPSSPNMEPRGTLMLTSLRARWLAYCLYTFLTSSMFICMCCVICLKVALWYVYGIFILYL